VTIKAYALGSCVALCLLHQSKGLYAMAHVVMADSIAMPAQAKRLPCYFADTALPFLLHELACDGNGKGMAAAGWVAKLVGGASILKHTGGINIGKRLTATLTFLLGHHQIPIVASDVGGSAPRTVMLHSGNGEIIISSLGGKELLL
jgi:chemotaxis protein CheD